MKRVTSYLLILCIGLIALSQPASQTNAQGKPDAGNACALGVNMGLASFQATVQSLAASTVFKDALTLRPAQTNAADLIIKEIAFEKSASQIRVRVLNQGTGASSSCFLALQSLIGKDSSLPTEQRVWTIAVPALEAGKGFSNIVDVAPLNQANGPWKAIVDRSNTVAESNENNNTLRYPAGNPGPFPPNWRRADLLITNFELTDPSHGTVKIEVANKGGGNAGSSKLRLIVWEQGKFEQKEARTIFVTLQTLRAGQTTMVIARSGVPIINTKFSMYVDISNQVAESNEDNNRAEGEAGNYKP